MEHWHIAKTKPHKEAAVMAYLSRWDVETFFPRITRPARKGGSAAMMEALFPTYLFCRVDSVAPEWRIARWAPGVSYFLSTDGQPARVPDDLVDFLRGRVEGWNQRRPVLQMADGDRITVTTGHFEGLEGVFRKYVPARRRCQIMLETVSGLMALEIPEHEIKPLNEEIALAV